MGLSKEQVEQHIAGVEKRLVNEEERKQHGYAFAKLCFQVKKYEDGIRYLTEYLTVKERDFRAHKLMGHLYAATGDVEKAAVHYKRSLELKKDQRDVITTVAELYCKMENPPAEALKRSLQQVQSLSATHPLILSINEKLQSVEGGIETSAVEDFISKQLALNSDDSNLHIRLVQLYISSGKLPEAFRYCQLLREKAVFPGDLGWQGCALETAETHYEELKALGCEDARLLLEVLIAVLEGVSVVFDLMLSARGRGVAQCATLILKFDKVLYASVSLLKSLSAGSGTVVYHVAVREMCGRVYQMAAEYFFLWGQQRKLVTPGLHLQLGEMCLLASLKATPPRLVGGGALKALLERWHLLACGRLSAVGRQLMLVAASKGEGYFTELPTHISQRGGRMALIRVLFSENQGVIGPVTKFGSQQLTFSIHESFLAADEPLLSLKPELPSPDDLLVCDQSYILRGGCGLRGLLWLTLVYRALGLHPPVWQWVSLVFEGLTLDTPDLERCETSLLCLCDLEAFLVLLTHNYEKKLTSPQPRLFTVPTSPPSPCSLHSALMHLPSHGLELEESDQAWWNNVTTLLSKHTGVWEGASLKKEVKGGLAWVRGCRPLQLNLEQLATLARHFKQRAEDIIESSGDQSWNYRDIILAMLKWSSHYWEIVTAVGENKSDAGKLQSSRKRSARGHTQEAIPILTQFSPTVTVDAAALLEEAQMALASAALYEHDTTKALKLYSKVKTPHAAWNQSQIYLHLAEQSGVATPSDAETRLSNLQRAAHTLSTAIARLSPSEEPVLREKLQKQQEEVNKLLSDAESSPVIRSLQYDSPEEGSLQPQRVSTPVRPRETASPMNRMASPYRVDSPSDSMRVLRDRDEQLASMSRQIHQLQAEVEMLKKPRTLLSTPPTYPTYPLSHISPKSTSPSPSMVIHTSPRSFLGQQPTIQGSPHGYLGQTISPHMLPPQYSTPFPHQAMARPTAPPFHPTHSFQAASMTLGQSVSPQQRELATGSPILPSLAMVGTQFQTPMAVSPSYRTSPAHAMMVQQGAAHQLPRQVSPHVQFGHVDTNPVLAVPSLPSSVPPFSQMRFSTPQSAAPSGMPSRMAGGQMAYPAMMPSTWQLQPPTTVGFLSAAAPSLSHSEVPSFGQRTAASSQRPPMFGSFMQGMSFTSQLPHGLPSQALSSMPVASHQTQPPRSTVAGTQLSQSPVAGSAFIETLPPFRPGGIPTESTSVVEPPPSVSPAAAELVPAMSSVARGSSPQLKPTTAAVTVSVAAPASGLSFSGFPAFQPTTSVSSEYANRTGIASTTAPFQFQLQPSFQFSAPKPGIPLTGSQASALPTPPPQAVSAGSPLLTSLLTTTSATQASEPPGFVLEAQTTTPQPFQFRLPTSVSAVPGASFSLLGKSLFATQETVSTGTGLSALGRSLFSTPVEPSKESVSVGEEDEFDGSRHERSLDTSTDTDFTPLVSLPELAEIKSGEEDEEALFCSRGKLFRFNEQLKEWKERGVGEMKILKHKESGKVRLLMRRDQVLKLCCNHFIIPEMSLNPLAGPSRDRSWTWYTPCNFVDGEAKAEKLAIRFKQASTAQEFKAVVDDSMSELASMSNATDTSVNAKDQQVESATTPTSEGLPPPSSESLLAKFAPPMGSWSCSICYIQNAASTTKCVACGTPKPGQVSSSAAVLPPPSDKGPESLLAKFAPPMGSWSCSICYIQNAASTTKCVACGTPKPGQVSSSAAVLPPPSDKGPESLLAKFAPPAGSWTCDACYVPNTASTFKCVACGTPKPALKFAPPAGSWTCDACYVPNTASTFKCVACGTPKPGQAPLKFAPPAGSWTCDACYISNTASAFKCVACGTPKPGQAPLKFDPPAGSWTCDACYVPNTASAFKCVACGTPKPGQAPLSTPGTASSLGSPLMGSSLSAVSQSTDGASPLSIFSKFALPGAWSCSVCFIQNQPGAEKCVACGAKRSDDGDAQQPEPEHVPFSTSFSFKLPSKLPGIETQKPSQPSGGMKIEGLNFGALQPPQAPVQPNTESQPSPVTGGIKLEALKTTSLQSMLAQPQPSGSSEEPQTSGGGFTLEGLKLPSLSTLPTPFQFPSFGSLRLGAGSGVQSGEQLEAGESEHNTSEPEPDVYFDPVVTLPESVELKTGEEDEEVMFTHRAKLYRFDTTAKQWKDRGVGEMKILKHAATGKIRVLMRRDQILIICCNHHLNADMSLSPQMGSDRAWTWYTPCDFADEVPKPEKLAVKFKLADTAHQFKQVFDECIQSLSTDKEMAPTYQAEAKKEDEDESVKAKVAPSPGSWSCITCLIQNNADVSTCVACGSVKPLDTASESFAIPTRVAAVAENETSETETESIDSSDDDVIVTYIEMPPPDKVELAKRYMLPPSFYNYENKPPCPGCIGCIVVSDTEYASEEDSQTPPHETEEPDSASKDTKPAPMIDSEEQLREQPDESSKPTETKPEARPFAAFSSGPSISFADLASSGTHGFGQIGGLKPLGFVRAGEVLFGSQRQYGEDETAPEDYNPESEASVYFKPLVTLPKVNVNTGEEEEDVLFSHRAKLFRFDGALQQWKERGVGDIKILRNNASKRCRVLMRRDQVLKICCNHYITRNMSLFPNAGSDKSWTWYTPSDFADEVAKPEKLAVKFKHTETAQAFKEAFDLCTERVVDKSALQGTSNKESTHKDDKLEPALDQGLEGRFAAPTGSWSCEICYVVNAEVITKCVACGTPKSQATAPTKAATSEHLLKHLLDFGPPTSDTAHRTEIEKMSPLQLPLDLGPNVLPKNEPTTPENEELETETSSPLQLPLDLGPSVLPKNEPTTPENEEIETETSSPLQLPLDLRPSVLPKNEPTTPENEEIETETSSPLQLPLDLRPSVLPKNEPTTPENEEIETETSSPLQLPLDLRPSVLPKNEPTTPENEEIETETSSPLQLPLDLGPNTSTPHKNELVSPENDQTDTDLSSPLRLPLDLGPSTTPPENEPMTPENEDMLSSESLGLGQREVSTPPEFEISGQSSKVPVDIDMYAVGEEDEELFSNNGRLLYEDIASQQWKDKGNGVMKILRHKPSERVRLLMVSDAPPPTVLCSHFVTTLMRLRSSPVVENSWVWYTAEEYSSGVAVRTTQKLCIQFDSTEVAAKFNQSFGASSSIPFLRPQRVDPDSEDNESYASDDSAKEPVLPRESFTAADKSPKTSPDGDSESPESAPVLSKEDNDVVFLFEELPEPELVRKAEELMLPRSFYLYERKPPCPGCIGCRDENEDKNDPDTAASPLLRSMMGGLPEDEQEKKREDEIANKECSPHPPETAPLTESHFASSGMLSFADIMSQSSGGFGEFHRSAEFKFKGTGTQLFASTTQQQHEEDGDRNPEAEADIHFKPVATLPETYTFKSWDDNADVLFAHRAKLFRFDSTAKQWKERGIGDMKIVKHSETGKVRLIMCRDQVLKICCNHYVTCEMSLTATAGSDKSWMWFTHCDFSDGEAHPERLSVRFKHAETAAEFKRVFDICVRELQQDEGDMKQIDVQPRVLPVKDSSETLASRFKPPEGTWTCDACYALNTSEDFKCVCCYTTKPAATEGSEQSIDRLSGQMSSLTSSGVGTETGTETSVTPTEFGSCGGLKLDILQFSSQHLQQPQSTSAAQYTLTSLPSLELGSPPTPPDSSADQP